MPEVIAHGRLLTTNEDGYLANDAGTDRIVSPWDEAVEAGVEIYQHAYGEELQGLYVRGSVARGLALQGFSDIDMFGVHAGAGDDIPEFDRQWHDELCASFKGRFPFVGGWGLEVWCLARADVLGEQASLGDQFLIFHSAHLWGENLQPRMPQFKPDLRLARGFLGQPRRTLKRVKAAINERDTPENVARWCRWYMRQVVREGSLLAMASAKAYTPDLYLCYTAFGHRYPDQARQMYLALTWAINPIADRDDFDAFLGSFCLWLVQELEDKLA